MLDKIRSLSLRWKFGSVFLVALLIVVVILLLALRGYLNREFETLYGSPSNKGLFIAEFLLNDLTPIIANDIESQEIEKTLNAYKTTYGVYGVSYIFLLDDQGKVLADTYKDVVPQSLIGINPMTAETPCVSFESGAKKFFDCGRVLPLPEEKQGLIRIGLLEKDPESPVWQTLKAKHVSAIFHPFMWLAIVLVIFATILLTLAFWYVIIRRIMTISQSTEKMSFGDLETVVAVNSQDELGILEDALERMRANLKDAIERLKRRK